MSITAAIKRTGSLLAVLLLAGVMILPTMHVRAANEGISVVTNKSVIMGQSIDITDLQITGTGDVNITLSIKAANGTFAFGTEDADVTGENTGYTTVSGLRSDVNNTLATLNYTPTGLGVDTIEVNLGSNVDNVIIDPIGGHAYTIVDDFLSWDDAAVAASQLQYGGIQGYLANVTSEEEDSFIVEHLEGNGWIGASDAGSGEAEGTWKWVAGPEAGTVFWSGGNAANGGHPVDDEYNNWNWNEPNNSGDEDCAEYIVGEGWNDLRCFGILRNYVVEFGAASVPDPIVTQFTITSAGNETPIGTCEELTALGEDNRYDQISLTNDIDCNNQTIESLFAGNTFQGTFDGNNHTIRNFAIDGVESVTTALIPSSQNATFNDLTIDNATLTSYGSNTATLLGAAYGSLTLNNIHVRNTHIGVTGESASYTGGLVAEVRIDSGSTATLNNISFEGAIDTTNTNRVGGLVGLFTSDAPATTIEQVYANAKITIGGTGSTVGGLFGELEATGYDAAGMITLRNAYSWGTITLQEYIEGTYNNVGGIAGVIDSEASGYDSNLTIQNVYSRGLVQGGSNVGGLFGSASTGLADTVAYTIENSFATARVTAFSESGVEGAIFGSIGDSEAIESMSLSNIYFDQTATEQNNCDGDGTEIEACTAVNTTGDQLNYFVNNTTNPPLNNWNFEEIWARNLGVPPTFSPVLDSDGDSIIDSVENAAPNGGDANNDGTADSIQPNIASLIDSLTGGYAVLIVDEACSITSVSISAESTNHTQDDGFGYPAGLMDYTIDCGVDGFTATITQYYYGVSGDFVVRKYNPNTQTYSTINDAATSDQTIASQQVKVASYPVTDGGELDLDGEENGIIVDPTGLAAAVNPDQKPGDLAHTGQPANLYILMAALLLLSSVAFLAARRAHHNVS